jgi:hypothetical protein
VVAGVEQFRDDDGGYLGWVAAHAHGFVINIQRSLNPADARLHHAHCYTINGEPPRGRTWTGPYVKICSSSMDELDRWALEQNGSGIRRCGVCEPPSPPNNASATRGKGRHRRPRRS